MHHLVVALCNGRRAHAQLRGYLLALEPLHKQHLKNDGVFIVTTIILQTDVVNGAPELGAELIV